MLIIGQRELENKKQMKKTLNAHDFINEFEKSNRANQFTTQGLFRLYDYFEEYEAETGEDIELDIIAICCEYTESTLQQWAKDYGVDEYLGYTELISRLSSKTYIVSDYTNDKGESIVIYQNY
jgi:hypothetical protein